MPKKKFTTVTPLPGGVSRNVVIATLQDHLEMIDLNPTHVSRHRIPPPPTATAEEFQCTWYQITDRISMCLGFPQKSISFNACFHDLANGSQVHCYAPFGLEIKQKWTVGGNAPGEPIQPNEIGIGAPIMGLYVREDVELKCNILVASFVRRTLKQALKTLVARLLVKTQLIEAAANNVRLGYENPIRYSTRPIPTQTAPTLLPSPHISDGGPDFSLPCPDSKTQRFSSQSSGLFENSQDGKYYRPANIAHSNEATMPSELP
ncbi:hypothetical protein K3495_g3295 [Podosphaera aphanis]|nr:hypothetical protein K3495_g3295 [Podosphaera aphanis]